MWTLISTLPDDPGAVDWHAVLRGVAHVLLRDVGGPDVVRGAADLKLTLGDEWNAFERIWNEIVNSPESIVLDRAVRHEPEMLKRLKYCCYINLISKLQFEISTVKCSVHLSHSDPPELVIMGGKFEPQNLFISGE